MSRPAGVALSRAFTRAAAVTPASPVILTCAVSGGIVTGNPNQPYTLDETVRAAIAAADAGASIVHIHARTESGGISHDPDDYQRIAREVRASGRGVLINLTTDGEGLDEDSIPSCVAGDPELATVVCGSTNFGPGDGMIVSPAGSLRRLVGVLGARGIVPEYECFDIGMVARAAELAAEADGPAGMVHLIAGTLAGLPADPAAIVLAAQLVPPHVPWTASSVAEPFRTMSLALALGGHVRTGLEDVVFSAPGAHAGSNAELVSRARSLCEAVGRPVATPDEAREILGLERQVGA